MGTYLYCLGDASHPLPQDVSGVDGAAVTGVPVVGFRAWISELERAPAASLERIRAHNTVVEAAARHSTPLPFRFGQWFEHSDALEQSLTDRSESLRQSLDHVRGRVEFGVRIVDPRHQREPPPDRASGKAYLEGLARRERQQEEARRRGVEIAEQIQQWLGPLVRDQRVKPAEVPALAAIAHLVDRHDTGNYGRRMSEFAPQDTALKLLATGPWPPYGFVE